MYDDVTLYRTLALSSRPSSVSMPHRLVCAVRVRVRARALYECVRGWVDAWVGGWVVGWISMCIA
jgi:hypothetical protein